MGDDAIFDDIVASTQPLNYNRAFLRKFDYVGSAFGSHNLHRAYQFGSSHSLNGGFNDDSSVIEEIQDDEFDEEYEQQQFMELYSQPN